MTFCGWMMMPIFSLPIQEFIRYNNPTIACFIKADFSNVIWRNRSAVAIKHRPTWRWPHKLAEQVRLYSSESSLAVTSSKRDGITHRLWCRLWSADGSFMLGQIGHTDYYVLRVEPFAVQFQPAICSGMEPRWLSDFSKWLRALPLTLMKSDY